MDREFGCARGTAIMSDLVEDRTHDGRKYRKLKLLDEFSHECLAIRVARKLKAIDVIDVLSDLFTLGDVANRRNSISSWHG
jgi:hypothetical protein